MKFRSASLVFGVALAGSATAGATTFSDNASIELFGGTNASMSGSIRATHPPENNPSGISYDHLGFDHVYDRGYTAGAEFDYAFTSRLSTYARGAYVSFNGRDRLLGMFASPGGALPVDGRFDDATTRELDLGARYTFAPDAKIRPFVGVGIGGADLSAVRATIQSPTLGATKVELARGDRVLEQRLEAGMQFSPARNIDVRLTASAMHYDGQRPADDPNLALLGLATAHGDVPDHWDYPVELGAAWHF